MWSRWTLVAVMAMALMMAVTVTPATAFTTVSGTQYGTWSLADAPYIVTGHVNVPAGQSLVIGPGVGVFFNTGVAMYVYGSLTTQGTPLQPVNVTSRADSSGGSPTPGQWMGVFAEAGSVINLNHTNMRYGGWGGWGNLVTSNGPAASVTWIGGSCDHSSSDGMRIIATDVSLSSLHANANAADGFEITPGNPPFLNVLNADSNGGFPYRINANPGNIPETLDGSGNEYDGIFVNGTLGGGLNGTWTWAFHATLPYVMSGAFFVNAGDTLSLGDRVVIKFMGSGSYLYVTGAGAHLHTRGLSGQRVFFTSFHDDQIGGDTNGNGTATMPAPGDWQAVYLDNGASADLQWTGFHYGGSGGIASLTTYNGVTSSLTWFGGGAYFSANDGVRVVTQAATINGLDLNDNAGDGFEIYPLTPPLFSGFISAYRNGGYAVRVNQNPGSFPGNWQGGSNGRNGIYVAGNIGGSMPAQTWTWKASGLPYVVGVLTANNADTLEIQTGSVVKFESASSYLMVSGANTVLRTASGGAPIWFSSLRDDAIGGDTNNDGAATAPAGGDWQSIYLDDGARADFTNTHVAYGGAGGLGNLATYSGQAAAINWNGGSTRNSSYDGARLQAVNASFSMVEANGNAGDGIEITSTYPPLFNQMVASYNGGYGLRVNQNPGSFPASLSGTGNGVNGIYVNGTFGGPLPPSRWTWGANPTFPYIIGIVTCSGTDSLEIAGGAVVKFDSPSAYLWVDGANSLLRTTGTAAAPVWFTSRRDDAVGGDTNNDGAATVPMGGDWQSIYLNNGCSVDFHHASLAYGGYGGLANLANYNGSAGPIVWDGGGSHSSSQDGIRAVCASASLSNLEVSRNSGDGFELNSAIPIVLDRITANDNGLYGMAVSANPGSFPSTLRGCGNGTDGILVTGTMGGTASDRKWHWGANVNFPYVVHQVFCNSPDSLEITAGAVVKLTGTSAYLWIAGADARLTTLGTNDNPVWFTSLRDDYQGGDTNNDGTATAAAPGDWHAIFVNDYARIALNETWCAYGGGGASAQLTTYSGPGYATWNGGGVIRGSAAGIRGTFLSVGLSDLQIAYNGSFGVNVAPASASTATGCDIFENENGGSSYGFYNGATAVTVDASGSWWGHSSGPYDPSMGPPSYNPAGLGDRVTDYVAYNGWAAAPLTNQPPHGFVLLAPDDGSQVAPTGITFRWRPTTDPEGMAIVYDLTVDDDPAFGSPVVSVAGLNDTTHTVSTLPVSSSTYYWRVIARDTAGGARLAAPATSVFTIQPATSVESPVGEPVAAPLVFRVRPPYPNPFRDATTLAFTLPATAHVRAEVFDVNGRLVHTLADEAMSPGEHMLTWEGRNRDGHAVATGVYFYRLTTSAGTESRRIVLNR